MISARIEEFVRTKDVAALTADLRAAGGPLVEPAGADVLVTFVWIGPQRQVSVRGAEVFADPTAMSLPMVRVPGTDVWHLDVRAPRGITTVYQYVVDDPFLDADMDDLALMGRLADESRDRSYADPFNPRRLYPKAAVLGGVEETDEARWDSVLELPGVEPAPWFDGPAPALDEHRFTSAALGGERTVSVYAPADARSLVVLLDGESWLSAARLHAGLASLMESGAMPPAVVAFVHNPPDMRKARMTEMACHSGLTTMLADELLPLLRSHYDVPGDVVVGGSSLGGLAACFAAYERPEVFDAVLSISGSHWWGYLPEPGGWGRDGEPEWLTRRFADAPRARTRFWIDVGVLETGASPLYPGTDHRGANRHLRTVLRAKGYDVTYYEAPGGHDSATFRRSAVRGLTALLTPAS
ncbi:alpha/beta hydrolase-fold protein [Actinomadura sp. DC4]|uniref:alpha/beta hydrolase-fold protein n=1 Tax=Actinomadura sp. DC4 TaxID=3055069 RepID=UPI0025B0BC3F|nr:alpha/beta hydrolase-fold protein [Actinomadura sp. DC4]MDN3354518.1 alpha/beta hydrolase-fold protein [Actinomadura sp. DC4]